MQWLVALLLSLVGYSLGAILGKRGVAGALAGVYAFAAYLVSSLVATVPALKTINYLSPFRYFNNPRVLDHGLQLGNVMIVIGACTVLVVLGWIIFRKRDIYQR